MQRIAIALIGFLAISVTTSTVFAQSTACTIVQLCELDHCPYLDGSWSDEHKGQYYTRGCQNQANERGYIFLSYTNIGAAPACRFIITIPADNFDCSQL